MTTEWKRTIDNEFGGYNNIANEYNLEETKSNYTQNAKIASYVASILENGYCIIPSLITDTNKLDYIKQETSRLHEVNNTKFGRNKFSGTKTLREYNILNETRCFDELISNKTINDILDALLYQNARISNMSTITIHPNALKQAWHYDNHFSNMYPKRTDPLKCIMQISTLFAIDDFTETNGATVIYPKSHLWPNGRYPTEKDKFIKAIMPSGSCVIYLGTVFHCGGANTSNKPRLAITTQQIQPWIRAQENFTLSTPLRIVPKLHSKIQSMIGFSIHPPGHGHVFGQNPKDVIEEIMTMNKYSKL
eukprot:27279_1